MSLSRECVRQGGQGGSVDGGGLTGEAICGLMIAAAAPPPWLHSAGALKASGQARFTKQQYISQS